MAEYRIELKNWKTANLESLKFILEHGLEHLEQTVEISNKITARAFTILSVLIPVLSVMLGILFNYQFEKTENMPPEGLMIVSVILIFPLLYCLVLLIRLIFPRLIQPLGRPPAELDDPDYLENPEYNKNQQYLLMIINEIDNCQNKIAFNDASNTKRIKLFKTALWVIVITLALATFLLILSSLSSIFG